MTQTADNPSEDRAPVQKPREGDIFRWRWKDEKLHGDSGPWRSYHCKSQIAIFHSGEFYDTFWLHCYGDGWNFSSDRILRPDSITLEKHEGNYADMKRIRPYDAPYYRPEDIVDLRHSNDSNAPIYLRPGATRNAEVILEEIAYRRDRAEGEIRSAQHTIERLDAARALAEAGKLDEVYL